MSSVMKLDRSKSRSVKIIDFKICSITEVYDYLKKTYKKPRYFSLPKIDLLERAIVFVFLYLRKIFLFFSILFRVKFIITEPKKAKNILFDDTNFNASKILFKNKNYFILKTRIERISEIYLSKKIITYLLKNFNTRSIKQNYLAAMIISINPKNVVTIIDNSIDFFIQAKIFRKKPINFIAVQNAHTEDTSERVKKNRFMTKYYTFSNFEKKVFKNKNLSKKIIPIGSIRSIAAKKYFSRNLKMKKIYDICVISEPDFEPNNTDYIENDMDKKSALVAEYCLKFSKKFKKKIIISGKTNINSSDKEREEKFYEYNLKFKNFKISFNDKLKFGSYKNIIQSEIIVASASTMLREAFFFNKKILWCNYAKTAIFPFKDEIHLTRKDYLSFEKTLLKLINMSQREYFKRIKNFEEIIYAKNDNFNDLIESLS